MNFIDHAFDAKLSGDDFLQAMTAIFSESDVRPMLPRYPQFVRDVIMIIDYDTELQTGGPEEVISGNLAGSVPYITAALHRCDAAHEAQILTKAASMTEKEFQNSAGELYDSLAINNDYDAFRDKVRAYIDRSLPY